jgi:DNA-binding YbaB/EbfC family protein
MFDMMKMMGKLGELKTKMAEAKERLEDFRVTGEAGAGMVKATVNGNKKLTGLEIDPTLSDPAEAIMLRDLIIAAVNDAQAKAELLAAAELKNTTAGLIPDIPGFNPAGFGL